MLEPPIRTIRFAIDKGASSPVVRSIAFKQLLMGKGCLIYAFLTWFLFPVKGPASFFTLGFSCGLGGFFFILIAIGPITRRRMAGRQANRWIYETHRVAEFDSNSLQFSYENGLFSKMPWEMVNKVMVDKSTIYIFTSWVPFHVPRAALPNENDEARLLEFCQSRKILASKVPPRS